ncbi:hypothetical protein ACFO0Q_24020 [Chryseobacterium bernardetii]|uniref:hypothetical protein n=1 Tax=Chryseobacterium bernardetii TaxID=1241978 RepID=UPI00360D1CC8
MIILQIAHKQNQKSGTFKNTPDILQKIKGKNRKAEGEIQIASGVDTALIRQPDSSPNHPANNSFYLLIILCNTQHPPATRFSRISVFLSFCFSSTLHMTGCPENFRSNGKDKIPIEQTYSLKYLLLSYFSYFKAL